MKIRCMSIVLVFAVLGAGLPASVAAKEPGYTAEVRGSVATFVGEPGIFIGTFRMTSFEAEDSTLLVKALLDGTISDGDRSTIGNIRREFGFPVASVTGGCGSVNVTLQPLGADISQYTIVLDPILFEDRGQAKKIDELLCAVGIWLRRTQGRSRWPRH